MSWIFYVLSPVLLHLVISEMTALLAGNVLDSAAVTALSAVFVLPFAVWMYRKDSDLHGNSLHEGQTEPRHRPNPDSHRHPGADDPEADDTGIMTDSPFMKRAAAGLLCLAGGGLLNIFWSSLLTLILSLLQLASYFSNATQEALLTSSFPALLLGPGLLVPAAEELIFRGLTYTRMRTRLSLRQAVFFSALLFALYHGNPIQMLYAFPMAMVLALIYEKGGTMVYPILFHMGANLTTILLL